jgi:soluble calcium-activated nucleotidase 1
MIHEAGRWSDVHARWFFLPRKLSREPYDEVKDERKCCNLFISATDTFDAAAIGDGEGGGGRDILAQPVLDHRPLRGCSDFFFIPGTNDTHIFVTRTEETNEGAVNTYTAVIDLEGHVLMPEALLKADRKFEGAAILDEYLEHDHLRDTDLFLRTSAIVVAAGGGAEDDAGAVAVRPAEPSPQR